MTNSIRFKNACLARFGASILIALMLFGFAFADERIDDVMYQQPAFPKETTRAAFSEKLKPLWLKALDRPDSELQRLAADTIALAHRSGMQGLEDTADKLITLLEGDDLEPTVRYAAARALVALEAKQATKVFFEAMNNGTLEMAMIVEPFLAEAKSGQALEVWQQRLVDTTTESARLSLAIECLGIARNSDATESLLAIVADKNAGLPTRFAAARSAARINDEGVLASARKLTSDQTEQSSAKLLAATLLTSQDNSEAVKILKQLASDDSTVVSGLALQRLFEIDPANVFDFADAAIRSKDVNVRKVGCQALVHREDADAILSLGTVLSDENPDLRQYVSNRLIQHAENKALTDAVIQASLNAISKDDWRGIEQASIVLGTLDFEPVAPRLFELLDHRRPEVATAASWGLRKLAIKEALPEMLKQASEKTKLFRSDPDDYRMQSVVDAQLSQLFQAFGEMDYADAEPLMRTFIPKKTETPNEKRAAAVWALGMLHQDSLDESLAQLLAKRLSDTSPDNPELNSVRRMSAIALGRMNAESHLGTLRRFVEEAPKMPGQACAWSLKRMTGEVHEFPLERAINSTDWFISPR